MARKIKLEYIAGQEQKILIRARDGEATDEDWTLLRHYEARRRKMYEKVKYAMKKYSEGQR